MQLTTLTLEDLYRYDPQGGKGNGNVRFRCPLCESNSRSISLDSVTGRWECKRAHCGAAGCVESGVIKGIGITAENPVFVPAKRDETPWQDKVNWAKVFAIDQMRGIPGRAYLETRGISPGVAAICGIRYASGYHSGRHAVLFDIKNETGDLVAVQGRFIDRGREPRMITLGPKKLGMFATPGCDAQAFAITEAPLDAVSLYAQHIPAMATCGSGNLPFWLLRRCRGKTVYVATDNDAAGEAYMEAWRDELLRAGAEVKRLRPPDGYKDWNDTIKGDLCLPKSSS